MTDPAHEQDTPPPRVAAKPAPPIRAGWVVALLVVAVCWAGVYAWRSRSAPAATMDGWHTGLDEGTAAAKETGRPMVLLFTASWCPPCQDLKRDVLADPAARAALDAGFVPVFIDLSDQSSRNPNLAVMQTYGVRGMPAMLLVDIDGEQIPGTVSYPDRRSPPSYGFNPEGFVRWLDSAR